MWHAGEEASSQVIPINNIYSQVSIANVLQVSSSLLPSSLLSSSLLPSSPLLSPLALLSPLPPPAPLSFFLCAPPERCGARVAPANALSLPGRGERAAAPLPAPPSTASATGSPTTPIPPTRPQSRQAALPGSLFLMFGHCQGHLRKIGDELMSCLALGRPDQELGGRVDRSTVSLGSAADTYTT